MTYALFLDIDHRRN